jgi:ribosome-associated translation inhibitor RaiA
MLVHLVTDNHIEGSEALNQWVTDLVTSSCERFGPQLIRVEVHLADENGGKEGKNDKRCLLEARLSGLEPVVASQNAATLEQCIDGALDILLKSLDRKLDRLDQRKGSTSFSGQKTL